MGRACRIRRYLCKSLSRLVSTSSTLRPLIRLIRFDQRRRLILDPWALGLVGPCVHPLLLLFLVSRPSMATQMVPSVLIGASSQALVCCKASACFARLGLGPTGMCLACLATWFASDLITLVWRHCSTTPTWLIRACMDLHQALHLLVGQLRILWSHAMNSSVGRVEDQVHSMPLGYLFAL